MEWKKVFFPFPLLPFLSSFGFAELTLALGNEKKKQACLLHFSRF